MTADLAPLLDLARALEGLHASGRAHGDVTVPLGEPAGREPAALVRERVAAGGPLDQVAFLAPELSRGGAATTAGDVFALGALIAARLSGRAPIGLVAPGAGWPPGLARALERALAPDPGARPPAAWLREALEECLSAPVAAPVAGPPVAGVPRVKLVAPGAPRPQERQSVSLILALLLLVGAAFTLAGALWLVAKTWDAIGEAGRAVLLFGLTGGVGGLGVFLERRGFARTGFAGIALATQLLWACGAYVIVTSKLEDEPGAWAAVGTAITTVTFVLALRRGSATLSTLATVAAMVALGCLGAALRTGTRTGPAVWSALMTGVLAGFAVVGHRVRGLAAGVAPACGAGLMALVAWSAGLETFARRWNEEPLVAFPTLWPYGVAAAAGGAWYALRRVEAPVVYVFIAGGATAFASGLTPTVEAFAREKDVGYLYAATAIGAALVIAAFRLHALAATQARQLPSILCGLVSLCLPPGVLVLVHLAGKDADALAWGSLALSPQERMESPLFYLPYVVLTATALVGLGVLFARDAERKAPYRLLELAGLGLFFVPLTLLSLAGHREWLHPLVIAGGGLAALAVGAWQRHLVLVAVPAAFLLLQGWIQYFAKLSQAFPLGLLLIGFGLGLLAGGLAFEKAVRPRLGRLLSWA